MPRMGSLHRLCNKQHAHAPWGLCNGIFAAAQECPYPTGLCKQYAALLCQQLLDLGAHSSPDSLSASEQTDQVFARATSNVQPRHRRLPPLLSRFKVLCKLFGPASALPQRKKLPRSLSLHDQTVLRVTPPVPLLPAGSRILGSWPVAAGQTGPSESKEHNPRPSGQSTVAPSGSSAPAVGFSPLPCPCSGSSAPAVGF